ncbi:MAG: DNA polymerase, partial [Dehalococcoidia bacterium]
GAPTVAKTMGVSVDEARAFLETYHARLPFVRATFNRAKNAAANRGWVKSILGRYRRFEKWEPKHGRKKGLIHSEAIAAYGKDIQRALTYTALNSVLQPSAADLMKKAMVDIWDSGACDVLGPPLLTVHDELAFSRPQTKAGEEAILEVKHIMEHCIELDVPIYAERESGPNWGEVK